MRTSNALCGGLRVHTIAPRPIPHVRPNAPFPRWALKSGGMHGHVNTVSYRAQRKHDSTPQIYHVGIEIVVPLNTNRQLYLDWQARKARHSLRSKPRPIAPDLAAYRAAREAPSPLRGGL